MAEPDSARAPGRTPAEGQVLAAYGLLRQLLSEADDQLAQARDALGDLAQVIPQSDAEVPAATQVLVVLNPAHVRERVNRCIEQAVHDFAFINQGRIVLDRVREHEIEDALIARGVRVRGLYEQSAIDGPGALDDLVWSLASGEEARATLTTPARWLMVDQEVVFTTARSGGNFHDGIIEVRHPALVALFAAYYELMWATAIPLADFREGPAAQAFDADDRALASLLATGMNDKAMGRQLGVSERTAHRRVAALMSRLGAESRFQAGVQAARLGLMG